MEQREQIIKNYIEAYNNFDVDGMVADFDETIKFENVSDGKVNLTIKGLEAFREQAEKAKMIFSTRKQTILSFNHTEKETEIDISYDAIVAMDLPNGLKKGDEVKLQGKSIFKFLDGKVCKLTDIS